jgi:hypothetical protein
MDWGPEAVAPAPIGLAGAQGHPHPQRPDLPGLRLELPLGLQGRRRRVIGPGEGGAEGVTHGPEDGAVVGFDGVLRRGIAVGQSDPHGRLMLLPQPGAALNAGMQGSGCAGGRRHYGLREGASTDTPQVRHVPLMALQQRHPRRP